MGLGASSAEVPPLARCFGDGAEARRGPTLGGMLLPQAEGNGWLLVLAAPLVVQVFDAHKAQLVPGCQDAKMQPAIEQHAPFTAFADEPTRAWQSDGNESLTGSSPASSSSKASLSNFAVGSQAGHVLVFSKKAGMVSGPICVLSTESGDAALQEGGSEEMVAESAPVDPSEHGRSRSSSGLASAISVLHFRDASELICGRPGKVQCWSIPAGTLLREMQLSGDGEEGARPLTPTCICVTEAEIPLLWVGSDTGIIMVFDADTGQCMTSFLCRVEEVVVSLAYFRHDNLIFALSAHRRVTVWDATTCEYIHKYPAELMTCGADLSSMVGAELRDPPVSFMLLAGIDGSLCVRRVNRRADGKINCVLLSYIESVSSSPGCPVTFVNYHPETDTAIAGDASCAVTLLSNLREHLCPTAVSMPNDAIPKLPSRAPSAGSSGQVFSHGASAAGYPLAKEQQASSVAAAPEAIGASTLANSADARAHSQTASATFRVV
eukprot:TRINITY_DN12792_c0_g1_i5.p1 TRINITY_DN12792_c0_g1~~TRINITY_DN12792_c0_g1_i5.p1  ORF type:complete len:493 (+),score=70.53 TRINITY_DN12792_c0_g1_i5:131-1609(+)